MKTGLLSIIPKNKELDILESWDILQGLTFNENNSLEIRIKALQEQIEIQSIYITKLKDYINNLTRILQTQFPGIDLPDLPEIDLNLSQADN